MDATLENPLLSGESSDGKTINETRDIIVIQNLKQKLASSEQYNIIYQKEIQLYKATIKDKNDLIKSLNTSIELIEQNKKLMIKKLEDEITDLQNALKFENETSENADMRTLQNQFHGNTSQLKAELIELKSKLRERDDEITKLNAVLKAEEKLRAIIAELEAKKDNGEPKEKRAKTVNNTSNVESSECTGALIYSQNRSEWPNIELIKIGDRKMPPLLENIPSAGADWMIILRRLDKCQGFSMNSCGFEKGFGNASGNFWLGLESIHQLTSSRRHELYIKIVESGNDTCYARYDNFVIGSKGEGYALKSLGAYSGNLVDALRCCENGKLQLISANNFWWFIERDSCCLTVDHSWSSILRLNACKMLIRPI